MRRVFNVAAELVAIVAAPGRLPPCAASGVDQAALLSIVVAVASLMLFFANYEKARRACATRCPWWCWPRRRSGAHSVRAVSGFKPVSAIAVIAGAAFGRRSGFMVGALAALVSNFFFGQGPWTPWQMYGWGLVGYLGGVLASLGAFDGVSQVFGLVRLSRTSRTLRFRAAVSPRPRSGSSP